jgi:hypothetical protein
MPPMAGWGATGEPCIIGGGVPCTIGGIALAAATAGWGWGWPCIIGGGGWGCPCIIGGGGAALAAAGGVMSCCAEAATEKSVSVQKAGMRMLRIG